MVLSKLRKCMEKVEKIMRQIMKYFLTKKTLLAGLLFLVFWKSNRMPREISTSTFLKCLHSKENTITSLMNLDNRTLFYEAYGKNFFSNYYVQDSDAFNSVLM